MRSISSRELFFNHIAQTSPTPIGLEIVKAKDCYMWDLDGKEYIDLISGFSVSNIGHSNEQVIAATVKQLQDYMHLTVYGEMIEAPQTLYAKLLIEYLPSTLNCVYFTSSGSEATEGAMKLAKRYTGRTQIISFKNSYHGSTQGALSILGDERWRNAYRPLLPGVLLLEFNNFESLNSITKKTACVIIETIQTEAGVVTPHMQWIQALRKKCNETGTLLVFDEIQVGFGRTGTLWAFEQFNIVPDILLLGKALGGGMPLGAFIADKKIMHVLTNNPALGHITTFGGHPVCCAAGLAAFKFLLNKQLIPQVKEKETLFNSIINHPRIIRKRSAGLLIAVEFEDIETNQRILKNCVQNGIIVDSFLFSSHCMRIAPPLIINHEEIIKYSNIILKVINS